MSKLKKIKTIFSFSILVFHLINGMACSMYKVTVSDKTVVGTNFDAYYTSPRIWFETRGKYGAAFSGGRISGDNGYAPQSGMNEVGLSFSRLGAPTPTKNIVDLSKKRTITDECSYLKGILHNCKSIEEVQQYISQYNHSFFIQDVFIYIEKSGKYLIVEPFTMTTGKDATYVLSNFCPSVTDQKYAHKLERYHKGTEFLKLRVDTTTEFCKSLSDTMHVCRAKVGDGTLLSSNWDLKNETITLYFYNDFNHKVQYHLKSELAKGDHFFEISKLFPPNVEFQQLLTYRIPQNTPSLQLLLMLFGAFFSFSSLYFLLSFFRTKKNYNLCKVEINAFPIRANNVFLYVFVDSKYRHFLFSSSLQGLYFYCSKYCSVYSFFNFSCHDSIDFD